MLEAIVYIVLGLIMLTWAADRFVDGASVIAWHMGVSPLLIGLTIVALGTSAPEIFVSITAAWRGNPDLAIGNALGSNIANVGLVVGLTALFYPLKIHSKTLRREYPILFLIMLLIWVLMLDGDLNRFDGSALFLSTIALILWLIRTGLNEKNESELAKEYSAEISSGMRLPTAIIWLVVGCALLPISSQFLVTGAITVAHYFGVSDLVIGLTIIAVGTSLPEIATAISAAMKGEDDIVIGNVIGSNMFNLVAVLAFPGLIHPSRFPPHVLTRDLPCMFVITIILYAASYSFKRQGRIVRWEGALLVAMYISYVAILYFSHLETL